MVRSNTVKLSDGEISALKQYRDVYDEDAPLGKVISGLVDSEHLIEQKLIIVIGSDREIDKEITGTDVRVVYKAVGTREENIRGFNADLVVLLSDVDDEWLDKAIHPMGAEVIDLT